MKTDWMRLVVQILSALAGAIGTVNLGRLTTAGTEAGPGDLAAWVGGPAVAAAAAFVGQRFLKAPSVSSEPGAAGHAAFCQSVYELAQACEWDRLKAAVTAWQETSREEPQ